MDCQTRWLMSTPLGRPVVPPVYTTVHSSSRCTSGRTRGAGAKEFARPRKSSPASFGPKPSSTSFGNSSPSSRARSVKWTVSNTKQSICVVHGVGVVAEGRHWVERGEDAPVHQRGERVEEHLGPVLRQDRHAAALPHADRLHGLHHLAGALARIRVAEHAVAGEDARVTVAARKRAYNQVGQQRLLVES